jgi:tRNA (guanine9-N1)-methyltransferase
MIPASLSASSASTDETSTQVTSTTLNALPALQQNKEVISSPKSDDIISNSELSSNSSQSLQSSALQSSSRELETLSKRQRKKQAKYQLMQSTKLERRKREKEHRKAKKRANYQQMIAENRRRLEEGLVTAEQLEKERQQSKPAFQTKGKKARDRVMEACLKPNAIKVIIDCSWDEHMQKPEIISLDKQLRLCYSENMKAEQPMHYTVTGLGENTPTNLLLKKQGGYNKWAWYPTDKDYMQLHADNLSSLVYLTAESENGMCMIL